MSWKSDNENNDVSNDIINVIRELEGARVKVNFTYNNTDPKCKIRRLLRMKRKDKESEKQ